MDWKAWGVVIPAVGLLLTLLGSLRKKRHEKPRVKITRVFTTDEAAGRDDPSKPWRATGRPSELKVEVYSRPGYADAYILDVQVMGAGQKPMSLEVDIKEARGHPGERAHKRPLRPGQHRAYTRSVRDLQHFVKQEGVRVVVFSGDWRKMTSKKVKPQMWGSAPVARSGVDDDGTGVRPSPHEEVEIRVNRMWREGVTYVHLDLVNTGLRPVFIREVTLNSPGLEGKPISFHPMNGSAQDPIEPGGARDYALPIATIPLDTLQGVSVRAESNLGEVARETIDPTEFTTSEGELGTEPPLD